MYWVIKSDAGAYLAIGAAEATAGYIGCRYRWVDEHSERYKFLAREEAFAMRNAIRGWVLADMVVVRCRG